KSVYDQTLSWRIRRALGLRFTLIDGLRPKYRLAERRDRRRRPALSDGRSRARFDPAAWICGDFAHVEADHPAASGTIGGDRAGPARHRRVGNSGDRP